ncbi:MAG TPA: TIGR02147 family protein [Polyangiaceae bacterium]|nr:TIGR02147 family protein [Polyangiaceae bacterium]
MTRPRQVFSYVDYRRFLADYYKDRKAHEYGFSYRVFSRRAGCRSSNYLCLVIAGKRNLTPEMAVRFAAACGLTAKASEFFCDLVGYGQAKSATEKQRWYDRLARFRQFRAVHTLSESQADYYEHWYIPVIRELAAREDFSADPKWIAKRLLPRVTESEAKQGLATLQALGVLKATETGTLKPAQPLISSGSGPLGHQVVAYHRAMLARASDALDLIPRDEREVSSLTLCVSQAKLLELKQRVREFRKELLQTAETNNRPERVVQLNFQLFPLSRLDTDS